MTIMTTAAAEKNLNVRIPSDVHEQLERLTKATGRSKSYLAMEALQSYLAAQSWQIADIQEAIAEADSGDFASEREVADTFAKYDS